MKFFLIITTLGIIFGTSFVPHEVSAQEATEYKLLQPIPLDRANSQPSDTTTAERYIKGIFTLIIAIAGGLAVVRIIFGGIQYMSTDAFEGKSEAKTIIQNAIWGLLLAISAWLILFTINQDLIKFDLTIPVLTVSSSYEGGGRSGGGGITAAGGAPLSQQTVLNTFRTVGITVAGAIMLEGLRQGIVDEIVRLKSECPTCNVIVTSATGGEHDATVQPVCNHKNGYKVDLRSNGQGATLTNYIKQNYQKFPNRTNDGAEMYRSPSGVFYAFESNHWDVTKC